MFVNALPRYEILSEDAMEVLDRGWRRIVSELGVEFLLPEAVELLRDAGQIVEEENRVRFDPEFILEQVAKAPREFELQARNPANSAHIGGDHTDLILVEAEEGHEEATDIMGLLRRIPHRQPVLDGVIIREHRTTFDRMRAAAMSLELQRRAMRCIDKCGRDIAVGLAELLDDIRVLPRVDARRAGLRRLQAVRHGGKRLVIDVDQGRGVFRKIARIRNDDRDRFSDEDHFIFGKRIGRDVRRERIETQLKRQTILRQQRSDVLVSEYRVHTRCCARRRRVDRLDLRMSEGAANESRFERAREMDVVDVSAGALDQSVVFDARDRLSDEFEGTHARSAFFCRPMAAAAVKAASTIP